MKQVIGNIMNISIIKLDGSILQELVYKWSICNLSKTDYRLYGQPTQWNTTNITNMKGLFKNIRVPLYLSRSNNNIYF
jgi:hypothetical protein